jgi:hypothetical protein
VATLLTLVVIPVVYSLVDREAVVEAAATAAGPEPSAGLGSAVAG